MNKRCKSSGLMTHIILCLHVKTISNDNNNNNNKNISHESLASDYS